MLKPNDIQVSKHFKLFEFEDPEDGHVVVLHPLLLNQLEQYHEAISQTLGHNIAIVVTSGTRTQRSNKRLANRFGWTDYGGLVSRNSRHLPKFGGIAVDFYALDKETKQIVNTTFAAGLADEFFDVVLDHYPTHIHVDLRTATQPGNQAAKPSEPGQ